MTKLGLLTIVILAGTVHLWRQTAETGSASHEPAPPHELSSVNDCAFAAESFPLTDQDLTVIKTGGAVLFTAGMTIDADGAPNAYAPHNRGLDYTANARGAQGWIALVTNDNGRPIIQ